MFSVISPAPSHPARFSKGILQTVAPLLETEARNLEGHLSVLDPFAGVGGIHTLARDGCRPEGAILGDGISIRTVGVELEPEWAAQHPRTLVGDARALPFTDATFDTVVTSPTYGNRMADHHNAKDGSKRVTYRHTLGRPLTPGNSGAMQWGERYRQLHRRAWEEVQRVLVPKGLFLLNVSNHIRQGEEVPVVQWHMDMLAGMGLALVSDTRVPTARMRFGENRARRLGFEHVMCLRKA